MPDSGGCGPVIDCLDFGGIHGDLVFRDDMSKELDGGFGKTTLVQSCEVVVGAKDVKHECKVLGMLGRIFGENEDVIEKDNHKIIQVWTEDVVHCTLKGGRCVGESEWHDLNW